MTPLRRFALLLAMGLLLGAAGASPAAAAEPRLFDHCDRQPESSSSRTTPPGWAPTWSSSRTSAALPPTAARSRSPTPCHPASPCTPASPPPTRSSRSPAPAGSRPRFATRPRRSPARRRPPPIPSSGSCRPAGTPIMVIPVDVAPGAASPAVNNVTVSGGGAPTAQATDATPVSADAGPLRLPGRPDLAHRRRRQRASPRPAPTPTSSTRSFCSTASSVPMIQTRPTPPPRSSRTPKSKLSKGLVVNPNATQARCTQAQLEANAGPRPALPRRLRRRPRAPGARLPLRPLRQPGADRRRLQHGRRRRAPPPSSASTSDPSATRSRP